jgi:hypothetical protein
MYGISKYIEQFYKDYYFSTTFWANDNSSQLILVPLDNTGAIVIVYSCLVIANPGNVTQTVTITDTMGAQNLVTYTLLPNTSYSVANFGHVVASNQVSISSSNGNVNFSLCYQYLTKIQPKAKHWTERP